MIQAIDANILAPESQDSGLSFQDASYHKPAYNHPAPIGAGSDTSTPRQNPHRGYNGKPAHNQKHNAQQQQQTVVFAPSQPYMNNPTLRLPVAPTQQPPLAAPGNVQLMGNGAPNGYVFQPPQQQGNQQQQPHQQPQFQTYQFQPAGNAPPPFFQAMPPGYGPSVAYPQPQQQQQQPQMLPGPDGRPVPVLNVLPMQHQGMQQAMPMQFAAPPPPPPPPAPAQLQTVLVAPSQQQTAAGQHFTPSAVASKDALNNAKIYVRHLCMETTAEHLREFFSSFGNITTITMHKERGGTGHCAYISYDTVEATANAIRQGNGSNHFQRLARSLQNGKPLPPLSVRMAESLAERNERCSRRAPFVQQVPVPVPAGMVMAAPQVMPGNGNQPVMYVLQGGPM